MQIWNIMKVCKNHSVGFKYAFAGINTAIEKLADYVFDEHNPMIGIVKDVAAGAVFIISILSVVIGLIILISRLNI